MNHSVHDGDKEHQNQHWQGDYFGPNGAIMVAHRKMVDAYNPWMQDGSEASQKENLNKLMAYLSTLYSAINHAIFQIAKLKLKYVRLLLDTYNELCIAFDEAMKRKEELDAGQQEVLIAVLLSKRFVNPFRGYRELAIELGEEISYAYAVGEEGKKAVAQSTYLLVLARLSRLSNYENADEYRDIVRNHIRDEKMQKELGWKTINRLARMVSDRELVRYSAKMDGSPDVVLKSGM